MRDWTLGPSDPLALTLAADFRLCTPDYVNDHIWELELGGGDPPALSVRTTYGLRARMMRLFPRFTFGSKTISDPATFPVPPLLRHFFPNFLSLDFSPFEGINMTAEYWVPESHTLAVHFNISNRSVESVKFLLELCGQLAPLDGQSLAPLSMQSANILAGHTANLAPVIFLTGGPQPGQGPYPSLALSLTLASGELRSLTWAQAALANSKDSFEFARHTTARLWEAERGRIEMVNAAQTVEVRTGDPDWDTAFALSQKTAFSLFLSPSKHLPYPSFVFTRQPDQGFSPRGDGSDYPHFWNGQTTLESYTLASLLPGAPELAVGLLYNFIAAQSENETIDGKPGLAGQRGRWLAAPILVSLAWATFQQTRDLEFLREVQPRLEAFIHSWFDKGHDRDSDGFPEWDHPLQSGLEDYPGFSIWHVGGQGADISTSENPALAAMLCREAHALANIAEILGQEENSAKWEIESGRLRDLVEECWINDAVLYHLRDRDSHQSPAGKLLGIHVGTGTLPLDQSFTQPVRLVVRLQLNGDAARHPKISIHGRKSKVPQLENLESLDFHWGEGLAVATTRKIYTHLKEIKVTGMEKNDRISVSVMDFSAEDVTLFVPLWAGIPNADRARKIVEQTLTAYGRFGRPFGIPVCAVSANPGSAPGCLDVHLLWNIIIGEGLLGYGMQAQAAILIKRLMAAVIKNLKQQHAFARSYHSETGVGSGERNSVQGLAPLGLFLGTLGVRIQSPRRVVLSGINPFPWPVTVKYRGLTITRRKHQTLVVFPDNQTVALDDPTDAEVSSE